MPRLPKLIRRSRRPALAPAPSLTSPLSSNASTHTITTTNSTTITNNVPPLLQSATSSATGTCSFEFTFNQTAEGAKARTTITTARPQFMTQRQSSEVEIVRLINEGEDNNNNNEGDDVIDSQSLSDSVLDYPSEFGRTYPAFRPNSYMFPNDPPELRRAALQYHTLNEVLHPHHLHLAPLPSSSPSPTPLHVLDLATGTGLWAIDFADRNPYAHVQGTDLSPIQPRHVPPNVHFFIEDAEEDWHPDTSNTSWDYIHLRCALGSFTSYATVIRRAFAALAPGAWLELQELAIFPRSDDGTLPATSPLATWSRDLATASTRLSRPLDVTPHLCRWLADAGFVDVHETVFRVPINPWPKDPRLKEIGRKWERVVKEGLSGFSYRLLNWGFGRSVEEIEAALVDVRRELGNRTVHAYHQFHVFIARKPFVGEARQGSGQGKEHQVNLDGDHDTVMGQD